MQDIAAPMAESKNWVFQGLPCRQRRYCYNGGSCTYFPRLNVQACNCTVGFEGARCEYVSPLSDGDALGARSSSKECTLGTLFSESTPYQAFMVFSHLIMIILLVTAIVILLKLYRMLKKRRRHTAPEAGTFETAETHRRARKLSLGQKCLHWLGIRTTEDRRDSLSKYARTSVISTPTTPEPTMLHARRASAWGVVKENLVAIQIHKTP